MAMSEVPADTTTINPTPSVASGFTTRSRAVGYQATRSPAWVASACISGVARVASTFAWDSASRPRIATI
jgi:hypothetical protein